MAERESDEGNIKIILCGETGAGKSTLSNTLLGRREFDSKRSREPVTTEVQKSDFCWTFGGNQFSISVCDTPGCLDGRKTDEEYLEDLMPHLKTSHVLLFCIEKNSVVQELQELKGIIEMIMHKIDHAEFPRAIIVLTQADKFVKDKNLNESQREINYNQELQSKISRLEATLREILGSTEVPVIVSSKADNKIPGDENPWLARMLYEILNQAGKTALFTSLTKCHPHLTEECTIKFEDQLSSDNSVVVLNRQSPTGQSAEGTQGGHYKIHAAGAAAGGATVGLVGAGVGATIGALAIGAPTFGVAAGAGVLIGGAIGGGIGVAIGTGGAALSTKLKQTKK